MLNFIGEVPPVDKVIAIEDCHRTTTARPSRPGARSATPRCAADRATLDRQITAVESLIPHS